MGVVDIVQAIRERAYALWESEGRPDGKAEAHWHQAAADVGASEVDPESLPPPDVNAPEPPPLDGAGASEGDPASLPPGNPPAS